MNGVFSPLWKFQKVERSNRSGFNSPSNFFALFYRALLPRSPYLSMLDSDKTNYLLHRIGELLGHYQKTYFTSMVSLCQQAGAAHTCSGMGCITLNQFQQDLHALGIYPPKTTADLESGFAAADSRDLVWHFTPPSKIRDYDTYFSSTGTRPYTKLYTSSGCSMMPETTPACLLNSVCSAATQLFFPTRLEIRGTYRTVEPNLSRITCTSLSLSLVGNGRTSEDWRATCGKMS